MNAVTIQVTVSAVRNQTIEIRMERSGHGDDVVEAHAAYFQHLLNGIVLGLQALKGKGDEGDQSGEEWKMADP